MKILFLMVVIVGCLSVYQSLIIYSLVFDYAQVYKAAEMFNYGYENEHKNLIQCEFGIKK